MVAAALTNWMMPGSMPQPVTHPELGVRPPVPVGRRVTLDGRGTIFVREVAGPPRAPTLLLLHGWVASGGLNWFRTFDSLSQHFHVIAPDLRGHGRGIRGRSQFRFSDCADDVAALCRALGVGPVIAVGYSMGGPVAQLLWRRHRELVAGLVFCATSASLVEGAAQLPARAWFDALTLGSRVAGLVGRPLAELARVAVRTANPPAGFREWAEAELRRHDLRMVFEAGRSICTYDAWSWVGDIDVPTGVVATTRDRGVGPHLQWRLASMIPDCMVLPVDDGHLLCARESFAPPLTDACLGVAARVTA